MMTSYTFDQAWHREKERLDVQAAMFEAGTVRLLESLGISAGWRCAEIAAGTGSVAAWMSGRVGPTGHVVATDLDVRFLKELEHGNLEVRRHDITAQELEPAAYDLVHTRLLLMHVAERERALSHMAAALRPGGWLLVEDYDLVTWGEFFPHRPLQSRVAHATRRLFEISGADPYYGRKLLSALLGQGLTNVESEGRLKVVAFGTPLIEALTLKLEQFADRLVAKGLLTREEIQEAVAEARQSRSTVYYPPLLVAAWGQRPA